ncbi:MAG: DEAD/DEAH box helicase [Proteobacteria bacterium]|nr:DEAD/DEAH box helicase [Pseudomonadota bacterium]MBU1583479.1 DEAD/DEAH box helicase [Pseudomonadota bacterium]MBU2454193.1 DEAD/DEAH box helicase [Pseudomonadota bacterium]MBU2627777.1 DEAD/DEAH box helicase [Pseudomonadota bacterium]
MSFEKLGLRADLLRAVAAQGYTCPTPIQAKAIPVVFEGRDVLAGARTGTGKTAAFALPILQRLSEAKSGVRHPRALILTPTRELAAQVGESFEVYGKHLSLRTTVIFGGVNINPQISTLRRGVDILVATPGRLLDHLGRKTLDLSGIQILVLDEADRMLDMGFINDIRKVIKLLPAKRQNMLFSATYSNEIKRLADGLLNNPALIEASLRNTAAEGVTQKVYQVSQANKRFLLSSLIREGKWRQALVFTRTKHGANKLTKQLLSDGVSAVAIHGNKSQATRTKALSDFKSGAVRTLVATDIAARGLDIQQLPHVVNFDLPHVPEDYIHRIGRTGRAGSDGIAHSLVSQEEQKLLIGIQRLLKHQIPVQKTDIQMPAAVLASTPVFVRKDVQKPRRRKTTSTWLPSGLKRMKEAGQRAR